MNHPQRLSSIISFLSSFESRFSQRFDHVLCCAFLDCQLFGYSGLIDPDDSVFDVCFSLYACMLNDMQRIRICFSSFLFSFTLRAWLRTIQPRNIRPLCLLLFFLSRSHTFFFFFLSFSRLLLLLHINIISFLLPPLSQPASESIRCAKKREKKCITLDHSHYPVFETKKNPEKSKERKKKDEEEKGR